MTRTIMAIDGGLADCGFARFDDRVERGLPRVTEGHVWRSSMKRKGPTDKVRRAMELAVHLDALVTRWSPSVVVCESMTYYRGVHANVAAGLVWGVLSATCQVRGVPLVDVRPQDWRATARRWLLLPDGAAEAEIHVQELRQVPGAGSAWASVMPVSKRVHLLDAIGVGIWAVYDIDKDPPRARAPRKAKRRPRRA